MRAYLHRFDFSGQSGGYARLLNSPARLAFNASRTVVEFVLQTWHERVESLEVV
jgi:hypothetical protein